MLTLFFKHHIQSLRYPPYYWQPCFPLANTLYLAREFSHCLYSVRVRVTHITGEEMGCTSRKGDTCREGHLQFFLADHQ